MAERKGILARIVGLFRRKKLDPQYRREAGAGRPGPGAAKCDRHRPWRGSPHKLPGEFGDARRQLRALHRALQQGARRGRPLAGLPWVRRRSSPARPAPTDCAIVAASPMTNGDG